MERRLGPDQAWPHPAGESEAIAVQLRAGREEEEEEGRREERPASRCPSSTIEGQALTPLAPSRSFLCDAFRAPVGPSPEQASAAAAASPPPETPKRTQADSCDTSLGEGRTGPWATPGGDFFASGGLPVGDDASIDAGRHHQTFEVADARLRHETFEVADAGLPHETFEVADAGLPHETFEVADAGLRQETFEVADAGLPHETFEVADAGLPHETFEVADAGLPHETFEVADAGLPHETFEVADTGLQHETFKVANVGLPHETFAVADAGLPHETFEVADAGLPHETFEVADAGLRHETFEVADAGLRHETFKVADAGRRHETFEVADAERRHETFEVANAGLRHETFEVADALDAPQARQPLVTSTPLLAKRSEPCGGQRSALGLEEEEGGGGGRLEPGPETGSSCSQTQMAQPRPTTAAQKGPLAKKSLALDPAGKGTRKPPAGEGAASLLPPTGKGGEREVMQRASALPRKRARCAQQSKPWVHVSGPGDIALLEDKPSLVLANRTPECGQLLQTPVATRMGDRLPEALGAASPKMEAPSAWREGLSPGPPQEHLLSPNWPVGPDQASSFLATPSVMYRSFLAKECEAIALQLRAAGEEGLGQWREELCSWCPSTIEGEALMPLVPSHSFIYDAFRTPKAPSPARPPEQAFVAAASPPPGTPNSTYDCEDEADNRNTSFCEESSELRVTPGGDFFASGGLPVRDDASTDAGRRRETFELANVGLRRETFEVADPGLRRETFEVANAGLQCETFDVADALDAPQAGRPLVTSTPLLAEGLEPYGGKRSALGLEEEEGGGGGRLEPGPETGSSSSRSQTWMARPRPTTAARKGPLAKKSLALDPAGKGTRKPLAGEGAASLLPPTGKGGEREALQRASALPRKRASALPKKQARCAQQSKPRVQKPLHDEMKKRLSKLPSYKDTSGPTQAPAGLTRGAAADGPLTYVALERNVCAEMGTRGSRLPVRAAGDRRSKVGVQKGADSSTALKPPLPKQPCQGRGLMEKQEGGPVLVVGEAPRATTRSSLPCLQVMQAKKMKDRIN